MGLGSDGGFGEGGEDVGAEVGAEGGFILGLGWGGGEGGHGGEGFEGRDDRLGTRIGSG